MPSMTDQELSDTASALLARLGKADDPERAVLEIVRTFLDIIQHTQTQVLDDVTAKLKAIP